MKYILQVTKTAFNLGEIRENMGRERGKHAIIRTLLHSRLAV